MSKTLFKCQGFEGMKRSSTQFKGLRCSHEAHQEEPLRALAYMTEAPAASSCKQSVKTLQQEWDENRWPT